MTSVAPTLAAPHPGLARLVLLHLRLLLREFPVAWVLFAVVILWMPAAALLAPAPELGAASPGTPHAPGLPLFLSLAILNTAAASFAAVVALLWPDAVWRNLPPGGRSVLDTLPVGRRVHRSARVLAGALLPLAMFGAVALTQFILEMRGIQAAMAGAGLTGAAPSVRIVVGAMGVLAAYAMGSALALRLGKVFFPLVVAFAVFWAVAFTLQITGRTAWVRHLSEGVLTGAWAPGRAFFNAAAPFPTPTLAVLAWLLAFGALAVFWAGRHDQG